MTRFCAACGTEVDDTAVFCPTCGRPIDEGSETAAEIPPAPAWPDPEPAAPARAAAMPPAPATPPATEPEHREAAERWDEPQVEGEPEPLRAAEPVDWRDQPTRVEPRPDHVDDAAAPPPPPSPGREPAPVGGERRGPAARSGPAVDLPLTMPVTLSAWLIGGGALLATVGAILSLFDGIGTAIDLVLLIGLVGVAATVFLSDRVPAFAHLRLATLAVVLVAFGVALDRLGFGRAGAGELLLFLGTAAAAIGLVLVETGNDQPMGGPSA